MKGAQRTDIKTNHSCRSRIVHTADSLGYPLLLTMHSLLLLISAGALALLGFSDPVSARPARPWHCEPWSGGAIAIAPLGVQGSETSACFAEDGVNCRHFASVDECKSSSLPAPSPGNTKFCTDSSDFCGLAVLRASNRFFCVPGVSTPVQVVGGDNLACLADDSGKACVWDGDCKTAGRFSGHGSKFLTCGSKTYFNKFGDYGYDNPWVGWVISMIIAPQRTKR